jgi:hypothetical protein
VTRLTSFSSSSGLGSSAADSSSVGSSNEELGMMQDIYLQQVSQLRSPWPFQTRAKGSVDLRACVPPPQVQSTLSLVESGRLSASALLPVLLNIVAATASYAPQMYVGIPA